MKALFYQWMSNGLYDDDDDKLHNRYVYLYLYYEKNEESILTAAHTRAQTGADLIMAFHGTGSLFSLASAAVTFCFK